MTTLELLKIILNDPENFSEIEYEHGEDVQKTDRPLGTLTHAQRALFQTVIGETQFLRERLGALEAIISTHTGEFSAEELENIEKEKESLRILRRRVDVCERLAWNDVLEKHSLLPGEGFDIRKGWQLVAVKHEEVPQMPIGVVVSLGGAPFSSSRVRRFARGVSDEKPSSDSTGPFPGISTNHPGSKMGNC